MRRILRAGGAGADGASGADAGATEAAADAGADAAAADAEADADTDAGTDADTDAAVDAATDAGADAAGDAGGPRYLAFVCTEWSATQGKYYQRMIDSAGSQWQLLSTTVPRAGDPVPPNVTPYVSVTPVDLPKLLAAAGAMDVSNAGYTTTTCVPTTSLTRMGTIDSATRPLDPTKVASYYNVRGMNGVPGVCQKVVTNDPAWQELRKYNCNADIASP